MEEKSEIWFCNNSINESNLNTKKEKDSDKNKLDLEIEEFKEVSLEVCKEIKWNKKRENRLWKIYRIGLKAMLKQ